jgi:hypothetical protein
MAYQADTEKPRHIRLGFFYAQEVRYSARGMDAGSKDAQA